MSAEEISIDAFGVEKVWRDEDRERVRQALASTTIETDSAE